MNYLDYLWRKQCKSAALEIFLIKSPFFCLPYSCVSVFSDVLRFYRITWKHWKNEMATKTTNFGEKSYCKKLALVSYLHVCLTVDLQKLNSR